MIKSLCYLLLRILAVPFKWIGILVLVWAAYWAISHYWTRSQMQTTQGTIIGLDTVNVKSSNREFGNYYRTVATHDQLVIEYINNSGQLQKFTSSQCFANDARQVGNKITVYFDDQMQEVNCLRAWLAPLVLSIAGAILLLIGIVLTKLAKRRNRSMGIKQ